MKVLIVGQGGREHAMAWQITRDPRVVEVLVAPGNGGTASRPRMRNLDIAATDLSALVDAAEREKVDLCIVGPEMPLVAGIVDLFDERGIKCLGPNRRAAQLEGSKAFSKAFMDRHQIPTAAWREFTDADAACDWILGGTDRPLVVKANGLAAGKGVLITTDNATAAQAARDILQGERFGTAGERILVEELLLGEEASFIALVSNQQVLPLASSQDHKARDNGDGGPNTGGMGAYSPAPIVTADIHRRIMDRIIRPAVAGMAAEESPYRGFLYAGLMIDGDGNPSVLEFNCRLGDPETQPLLLRLHTSLVALAESALEGTLDSVTVDWDPRPALGVVMVAGGYPDHYRRGDPIQGLPTDCDDAVVFHAGTRLRGDTLETDGGRVLCATALGNSVTEAQHNAYQLVRQIQWRDSYHRTDIGHRAITRERT